MKKVLKDSLLVGFILLITLFIGSCNQGEHQRETKAEKYTCPMHPQIIKDEPGTCPICGMDLVPQNASSGHGNADESLNRLVKPVNEVVLSQIKTVKPQAGSRFSGSTASGIINYSTNNLNSISSRISGRIERLYVKYNYQQVTKGQKLMDIYSPDLATAQQELLFLKQNGENDLLEAAKRKLRLLGATGQQINQVLKTGKVDYTFTVYSPYSGYVIEKQSISSGSQSSSSGGTMITGDQGSSGSMGGMSDAPAGSIPTPEIAPSTPLLLREGQYVSTGQKLFDLANSGQVWAEFFVSTSQLKEFKRGTEITVEALNDPSQKANVRISLVQPYYKEGTKFAMVRATINNSGNNWKVGQLVNLSKVQSKIEGIWLPKEAVMQTGTRYVAFVKNGPSFKPEYVTVSGRSGNWVNIGNSLKTNTEVAANAWFLMDSESFVK